MKKQVDKVDKILISVVITCVLALFCLYYVNKIGYFDNNNVKPTSTPVPTVEPVATPDVKENMPEIATLKQNYNNNNIVGYVYIPNTDIDEVVAQYKDNDYYLNHNLYNNKDVKGSIFLDYRMKINEGRKNIIYGHNSSNLDVPFRELENYYDKNYFDKNRYIYVRSADVINKYEVFSLFVETSDWTYTKVNFESDEEWLKHINMLKDRSWYDTGVEVNENDRILILQTCSHHKDYTKYKNKYFLVISKLVESIS